MVTDYHARNNANESLPRKYPFGLLRILTGRIADETMICDLHDRRGRLLLILSISVAIWLLSDRPAWADIGGRGFVVAVNGADGTSLEESIADAATHGVTGVLLVVGDVSDEVMKSIRQASDLSRQRGLEFWLGITQRWETASRLMDRLDAEQVAGIALLFPMPQGEPAELGDLAAQMEIKKRGEQLGQLIRQVKATLSKNQKLAVGVAASEIDPETARDRFLPVKDLVRDGTLDCVCLAGAERMNFHRLRLLREAPLAAGIYLDGSSSEERQRGGLLERAVLAAVDNPTCDCLWLNGFPTALAVRVVPQAVERRKQAMARQQALEEAIQRGTLIVDQGISEKDCNDQATVHGVAQSFVPSRDGECPLVQLYAAIRGCSGPLPPSLQVEIRSDDNGKPGESVLAKTQIPATEFGHEPTYRWGNAYFDSPVTLRKGKMYWIRLPAARHVEGNFVWRIVKDGANARGQAWSRSYDYANHTWVFRVFMTKED